MNGALIYIVGKAVGVDPDREDRDAAKLPVRYPERAGGAGGDHNAVLYQLIAENICAGTGRNLELRRPGKGEAVDHSVAVDDVLAVAGYGVDAAGRGIQLHIIAGQVYDLIVFHDVIRIAGCRDFQIGASVVAELEECNAVAAGSDGSTTKGHGCPRDGSAGFFIHHMDAVTDDGPEGTCCSNGAAGAIVFCMGGNTADRNGGMLVEKGIFRRRQYHSNSITLAVFEYTVGRPADAVDIGIEGFCNCGGGVRCFAPGRGFQVIDGHRVHVLQLRGDGEGLAEITPGDSNGVFTGAQLGPVCQGTGETGKG